MKARSLLFDLWGDYIQHKGGEVWTGTLAVFLGQFGIREDNLRQALSRMSREGWLISRRAGNRSFYSLTPRGRRRIVEAARRVYNPVDAAWDGYWRTLVYSIPETMRAQRDELRRELAWTGFGALAPGTWISPNRLEEALSHLIGRYGLQPYATSFLAHHTGPGTPQELVRRCWDLESLQASYDRFLRQWAPRLSATQSWPDRLQDEEAFVERMELVHDYRKFLFVDPGLPRELLPSGWKGFEARQLFQEYYTWLDVPARRYMDAVYNMGGSTGDVQTGSGLSEARDSDRRV